MRLEKFGDSYDIVQLTLLGWLSQMGPWAAHPMFPESVSAPEAAAFGRFLGVPLLSSEVLAATTEPADYFRVAETCGSNLFLDPDTGLGLKQTESSRLPEYLLGDELVRIVEARRDRLTLVFDQSVARGREREHMQAKMAALSVKHVHGWAYVSHACFLLAGADISAVGKAAEIVREQSRLPACRIVCEGTAEQADAADEAHGGTSTAS